MTKTFLLTGYYFDRFHGSMMHLWEIGKYLKSKKYRVVIVSVIITEDVKKLINQDGIELYNVYDCPVDVYYDYVLSYHYPILPCLLRRKLKYGKVMCGSLSHFVSLEKPSFLYKTGIPIQVHCGYLQDYLKKHYDIKNIFKMPNLIPHNFTRRKLFCNKKVKSIAIISNHIPDELRTASALLAQNNIKVDIYGMKDTYIPVTPYILSKYDVVVTIGKTVQYALGLGIPCYNYDYFGGDGYITIQNIEYEEYYNFSGRPNNRKLSAEKIMYEIISTYSEALKERDKLRKIAVSKYLLSRNIDALVNYLDKMSAPEIDLESKDFLLYYEYAAFPIELQLGGYNNSSFNNVVSQHKIKRRLYYMGKYSCRFIPVPLWRRRLRRYFNIKLGLI